MKALKDLTDKEIVELINVYDLADIVDDLDEALKVLAERGIELPEAVNNVEEIEIEMD